MTRFLALVAVAVGALAVGAPDQPLGDAPADGRTEVVVALASPPLGIAPDRAGRVAGEQRAFRRQLAERLPDAHVRWRYRLVANGFAVDLPTDQVALLRRVRGVKDVFSATGYGPQLDRSPGQIGAPGLWGSTLGTSGQGIKIGIIDTGVDPSHPFLDPAGYVMPPGYPRGQERYTSAKVIVARAFPPPGATSPLARQAFDPQQSDHGTHVAGIAAGNPRTEAPGGRTVSGIAPRAYVGNYKALVRTEFGLSPNGNAPELVAAIEAAVQDGMDVINLSIGEPEIEPQRDVVALALDAAAAAGVVPVVAAGNDYNDVGAGSVSSPASSLRAITVAAAEVPDGPASSTHADFSSVGPTTISLRMKPDVAAPGVDILSSVPNGWQSSSGTSMATPHVSGAAALLLQRHATWTVAEVKSALVQTGTPIRSEGDRLFPPTFTGGGLVALARADRPLLFAEPSGVSLGLLARGSSARGSVVLADAGDGVGAWQVEQIRTASTGAATLVVPTTVAVPGELAWEVRVPASAREGDVSGFLELRRGSDVRRVPFWGRVAVSALPRHRVLPLTRTGVHRGTTKGRPALVARYRYPEDPRGVGVTTTLRGPETVYRIRLARRVANFGVVITQRPRGSRVEPRLVAGLDENRVTGYAGLPFSTNPYIGGAFGFRSPLPVVAALSPVPGEYAVVFDSAQRAGAGAFTFRYWVNDVTPPALRLRTRFVPRGATWIRVAATDAGSGVHPGSLAVTIDGRRARATYAGGIVRVRVAGLEPGSHRLVLRVSDYQESKNTENVARVLANTRTLATTFRVRER
jgi:subtilisin family serine protease